MRQLKIIGVVVGLLAVGYVLGVFTAGRYFHHRVDKMKKFAGGRYMDNLLFEEMSLNQEQQDTIRIILDNGKKTIRAERRAHFEAFHLKKDKMIDEIKTHLTAEQVVVFEEKVEAFHKEMRKHREEMERRRNRREGHK